MVSVLDGYRVLRVDLLSLVLLVLRGYLGSLVCLWIRWFRVLLGYRVRLGLLVLDGLVG